MGETTDPVIRGQSLYEGGGGEGPAVCVAEVEVVETVDTTADIRDNIEHTRAQMSETIDAIQNRLDPAHLKEQVIEQLKEQLDEARAMLRQATIGKVEDMVYEAGETVKDARHTLTETIRENPIPTALAAIGIGWLFMNARSVAPRRDRRYDKRADAYGRYLGFASIPQNESDPQVRYDGRRDERGYFEQGQQAVAETYDRVQRTAGEFVEQAKETAGDLVDQARETAGQVAGQVQYQAARVEERFQDTLHDNPLAIGALALAVGTAIGFALPQTSRENELMGETRDALVDRAQEAAQETVEQVRTVAQKLTTEVQHAMEDEVTERRIVNR